MRRCMICLTRYYLGVHIGVADEWSVWGIWYVWGRRDSYRALVGKPEGNRPLGRNIWEDNITVDLK
jgi:hypothetical protein